MYTRKKGVNTTVLFIVIITVIVSNGTKLSNFSP